MTIPVLLFCALGGIILLMAALEAAARVLYRRDYLLPYRRKRVARYPFAQFIEDAPEPLVYRLKPGVRLLPVLQTNRFGLRGFEPAADGRKRRIWLLGESECFGSKLPREKDLWIYELQRLLDARGFDRWEALNVSVSGYSSTQIDVLWRGLPARAGDVLLLHPSFNDLVICRTMGASWRPGASWPKKLVNATFPPWWRRAAMHTCFYAYCHKRFARSPREKPLTSRDGVFRYEECKEQGLRILDAIVADAEARGIRPALMSFFPAYRAEMPADDYRRVAALESTRFALRDEPVAEQFDLMNAAIERFVTGQGLPLIDLASVFWNHPDRFSLYIDMVHLNAAGHRVLARALFDGLCRACLLDAPRSASPQPAMPAPGDGPPGIEETPAPPVCVAWQLEKPWSPEP
jgi:hypothetical protein